MLYIIGFNTSTTHAVKVVLFSIVFVFVCLSVNRITPEPFEPSQNLHGIIPWSKGWTSSKMAIQGCTGGSLTPLMLSFRLLLVTLTSCWSRSLSFSNSCMATFNSSTCNTWAFLRSSNSAQVYQSHAHLYTAGVCLPACLAGPKVVKSTYLGNVNAVAHLIEPCLESIRTAALFFPYVFVRTVITARWCWMSAVSSFLFGSMPGVGKLRPA